MAVEKLLTIKEPSSSILEILMHALIEEGFSLVDVDREKGFISGTIETPKFLQNISASIFSLPEGSLVRILCTARSETSAPSVDSGISEDGMVFESPCRKTLGIILGQTGDWHEVSREWAEEHGIQLEHSQHKQESARAGLIKFGLWGGLVVAILGSLLAYLNLSERMKLASPQVWIMVAVIGVFIFCISLFSRVWRRQFIGTLERI